MLSQDQLSGGTAVWLYTQKSPISQSNKRAEKCTNFCQKDTNPEHETIGECIWPTVYA